MNVSIWYFDNQVPTKLGVGPGYVLLNDAKRLVQEERERCAKVVADYAKARLDELKGDPRYRPNDEDIVAVLKTAAKRVAREPNDG